MDAAPVRRQNHSCDQCRRSKRRCVPPPDSEPKHGTCRNCKHLGYVCTYEFSNSHAARKKRSKPSGSKPQARGNIPTSQPTADGPYTVTINNGSPEQIDCSAPLLQGDGQWDGIGWTASIPAGVYDVSPYLNDPLEAVKDDVLAAKPRQDLARSTNTIPNTNQVWSIVLQQQTVANSSSFGANNASGHVSPRSPIGLLNSKCTLGMTYNYLTGIYDAMLGQMAARFLDSKSNPFAGSHQYVLKPEKQSMKGLDYDGGDENDLALTSHNHKSAMLSQPKMPASLSTALSPAAAASPDQLKTLTLIGACRFLDNFGPFFGNHTDRVARARETRVLGAVAQAFALQCCPLPPSTPNCDGMNMGSDSSDLFTSAWFKARKHLVESESDCSFTHIYTVFLFHLTAVPEQAKADDSIESSPVRLLDQALRQMQYLGGLVDQYCLRLGKQSLYRTLIQSSMRVIRWYSYLRDTVASLIHQRDCIMEYTPLGPSESDIVLPPMFNPTPAMISDVCQYGVTNVFGLYRKTIAMRKLASSQDLANSQPVFAAIMKSTMTMIESFNVAFKPWFGDWFNGFDDLPMKAQLGFAFLVMFWNLGVLRFVDQMKLSVPSLQHFFTINIANTSRAYQQAATAAIIAVCQLIMQLAADQDVLLPVDGTDLRMPFVAHHANTQVVASALKTAIEHIIDLNAGVGPMVQPGSDDWIGTLKPVLWCLLSLEQTNAGRCTARPVLQDLLNKHGDVLMECWSPSE